MSEEEMLETLTNYNLVNHFNNTKFFEALKCLLNMYNKEKEKNTELQNYMKEYLIPKSTINLLYISKDKIRDKIEEIKNTCYYNEGDATAVEQVFILEKILEE